jgi:hypothetical protein
MVEIMRAIKLIHVFFNILADFLDKILLMCHLEFSMIVRREK